MRIGMHGWGNEPGSVQNVLAVKYSIKKDNNCGFFQQKIYQT